MTFYRFLAVSALLAASLTSFSVPDGRKGAISRGIGVYPGNPDESFAPRMVRDGARRNLALNRIVSTSSDFDYNLTGQLLTDGIICNGEVSSLEVFTPQGPVDKKDRESAIDGGEYSRNVLEGEDTWLDYRWSGYLLRADSVAVACEAVYRESDSDGSWRFSLESAGEDGRTDILGSISGDELPGRGLRGPMHTDPNKQTAAERMPGRRIRLGFRLDNPGGVDNARQYLLECGFFKLFHALANKAAEDERARHHANGLGQQRRKAFGIHHAQGIIPYAEAAGAQQQGQEAFLEGGFALIGFI